MLFTQFEFIFVFLPVTLAGYFILGAVSASPLPRVSWLALASLAFYSYWDVRFLPIIGVSIVANYAFGWAIDSADRDRHLRKIIFVLSVTANLAALGYFKYANFGLSIVDSLFHAKASLHVTLPLGISFFTFTQIAYLADVYGGYTSERNFAKYALFVSYFPHLVAGPILHHKEMMPQFGAENSRYPSSDRMSLGLSIFAIGLFKKLIIADGFALIASPVFLHADVGAVSSLDAWGGALAYSLQIYFDFSGYSDMAIGLSLLFGIMLPFNFDAPYKARSISEFWRRWHITLSRFLRDYLYIPLGGNRCGALRHNLNLFATMLLGGLWHGAGWTFIIWGGLHGLYLLINHAWVNFKVRKPALDALSTTLWFSLLSLALTQVAVVVAWVYFRADGIHAAHRILRAMAHFNPRGMALQAPVVTGLDLALVGAGFLACLILPNVIDLFQNRRVGIEEYRNTRPWSLLNIRWQPTIPWAVAVSLLLVTGVVVGIASGAASPFLYFQF